MQIITVDANGFTKKTKVDIRTTIQNALLLIDQALVFQEGTVAKQVLDILTDLVNDSAEIAINNIFNTSLENAEGQALDNLAQLIGLIRFGGTQTIQPVNVTVNRTVSLQGGAFKVKDQNQNVFVLVNDAINLTEGTHILSFIAEDVGVIKPILNSVTIIETPLSGVVSVNNTVSATTVGTDYETDDNFKIRIKLSRAINSRDWLESILANLLAISGVTFARVLNNRTTTTNALGILPNHVAVTVEGGNQTEIVNVISQYVAKGVPTQGDISAVATLVDGQEEIIFYNTTDLQPIMVKITLKSNGGLGSFDFIKEGIASNITFDIGQIASADVITEYVKSITKAEFVIEKTEIALFALSPVYVSTLDPATFKTRFVISVSDIIII